jgi:hypothetical protein
MNITRNISKVRYQCRTSWWLYMNHSIERKYSIGITWLVLFSSCIGFGEPKLGRLEIKNRTKRNIGFTIEDSITNEYLHDKALQILDVNDNSKSTDMVMSGETKHMGTLEREETRIKKDHLTIKVYFYDYDSLVKAAQEGVDSNLIERVMLKSRLYSYEVLENNDWVIEYKE